jgi:MAE_28990/MAE_18760-like HEPN
MAQLRTAAEFSHAITADLTWRIKEISDLRSAVRRIDEALKRSLLRASVPLVYAHWEGHVAVVSRSYVEFLATRRPRYSTIKPSFRLNEFSRALRRLGQSQMSYRQKIEFIESILQSGDTQFRRIDAEVISGRGNLNSEVLKELCAYFSIDQTLFEDDYDFIDKILVFRRNNIAHGEYIELDQKGLEDMSNRVIGMMRTFNNLVDNDVVLGRYNVAG